MQMTDTAIATAVATREARRQRLVTALLLAPSTLWFVALLLLPLAVVVVFSFGARAPAGGYQAAFTLEQYLNLPARWAAFKNTLILAPAGTLISLLAAYPLAYYLAVKADRRVNPHPPILVIVAFLPLLPPGRAGFRETGGSF